ncbi:MAG TPA: flavin reductase family protein [Methanobacterium sp.]|nr:flavin reductase family protein [Methanobacterium sp.]
MKKSRYATPIFIIGTYDKEGKPNAMNAILGEISGSDPQHISVSIKETTFTHKNILDKEAFTVNIPSATYIEEIIDLKTECGKNEDKFTATGLTPVKSELVDAPYIKEFPLALECKLVKATERGLCTSFTGEVLDAKWIEDSC